MKVGYFGQDAFFTATAIKCFPLFMIDPAV
jgi:hypothetical protein